MFNVGDKVVCFLNGNNYYTGNYVREDVTCLVISNAVLVNSRTGKKTKQPKGDRYVPNQFINCLEHPLIK
jgi:hypothetical protein